jgi:hypothetical protein
LRVDRSECELEIDGKSMAHDRFGHDSARRIMILECVPLAQHPFNASQDPMLGSIPFGFRLRRANLKQLCVADVQVIVDRQKLDLDALDRIARPNGRRRPAIRLGQEGRVKRRLSAWIPNAWSGWESGGFGHVESDL